MSIAEKFEVIADAVYEKGRQDEWSDFWDAVQDNGNKTNYSHAFYSGTYSGHKTWNSETFKPKYDMRVTNSSRMFLGVTGFNLAERLIEQGVILDTSKSTDISFMFQNANLGTIPSIDGSSAKGSNAYSGVFAYMGDTHTIQEFIVADNDIPFTNTFVGSGKLQNITFGGVIAQDISFADSPLLSDASLENIAQHLKDFLPEWKEGDGDKAIITLHATVKERIKNTEIENLIKSKKWGIA